MRLRGFLFYQTKNLGKRFKLIEESLTKPTHFTPQGPEAALLIEREFLRD
ncbi:MAG: hypothetical protein JHC76_11040 [Akkermansiaceae bacterium]|nr:hypothetical protein [Akkermansiaceae bacterium]